MYTNLEKNTKEGENRENIWISKKQCSICSKVPYLVISDFFSQKAHIRGKANINITLEYCTSYCNTHYYGSDQGTGLQMERKDIHHMAWNAFFSALDQAFWNPLFVLIQTILSVLITIQHKDWDLSTTKVLDMLNKRNVTIKCEANIITRRGIEKLWNKQQTQWRQEEDIENELITQHSVYLCLACQ